MDGFQRDGNFEDTKAFYISGVHKCQLNGISQLHRSIHNIVVIGTRKVHFRINTQFFYQLSITGFHLSRYASIHCCCFYQFLGKIVHILLERQEAEGVESKDDDHHGCHNADHGIDIALCAVV